MAQKHVEIESFNGAIGNGFVADGRIITAAHVIAGSASFVIANGSLSATVRHNVGEFRTGFETVLKRGEGRLSPVDIATTSKRGYAFGYKIASDVSTVPTGEKVLVKGVYPNKYEYKGIAVVETRKITGVYEGEREVLVIRFNNYDKKRDSFPGKSGSVVLMDKFMDRQAVGVLVESDDKEGVIIAEILAGLSL